MAALAQWIATATGYGGGVASQGEGAAAVQLVFWLLCLGIAADAGILIYLIKRPSRAAETGLWLRQRVLPGRVLVLILLSTLFFYILATLLHEFFFAHRGAGPHTVFLQALGLHLPVLVILVCSFFLSGIHGADHFGVRFRGAGRMLGLSLLLYMALLPPLWVVNTLYQKMLQWAGRDVLFQDVVQILSEPSPALVRTALFTVAIVVAPVFEETLFRGILLPLLVKRTGLWTGTVLTSLLFAGVHFHLPALLPLFLLSVALCLAYGMSRSLLVPIGMHAAFNGATVLLLHLP